MAFELSGKLIEILDTVQVSDSFRKREFVIEKIETAGGSEFTNYIKFQLTQDRCNLIDSFKLNEPVKITFNIRGNRWERDGRVNYFTNLAAWRIEKESFQEDSEMDVPFPGEADTPPSVGDEDNDLPF